MCSSDLINLGTYHSSPGAVYEVIGLTAIELTMTDVELAEFNGLVTARANEKDGEEIRLVVSDLNDQVVTESMDPKLGMAWHRYKAHQLKLAKQGNVKAIQFHMNYLIGIGL